MTENGTSESPELISQSNCKAHTGGKMISLLRERVAGEEKAPSHQRRSRGDILETQAGR